MSINFSHLDGQGYEKPGPRGIMENTSEEELQGFIRVATEVCQTPVAFVFLLDADQQWQRSSIGVHPYQGALQESFCSHIVANRRALEVPDATEDLRFCDTPGVAAPPRLRYFYGLPLITTDGTLYGVFCVVDIQPRNLACHQKRVLGDLATQVVQQLRLQRQVAQLRASTKRLEQQHQAQTQEIQALGQSNLALENSVQLKTQALRETNRELDTFLYRSSHDLTRPITSLIGLAMLADKCVKEAEGRELFGRVMETALSMRSMLRKLLMVHDILNAPRAKEKVDLASIVEKAQQEVLERIPEAKWQLDITNRLPKDWMARPQLFNLIFVNILENTWHFRAKTREEAPTLSIWVESNAKAILLHVKDNGAGIHPDALDHVFDMFYRGSEDSLGNGLGLYLVSKAALRLGGSVTVKSLLGQGTQLSFEFRNQKLMPTNGG